MTSIKLISNGDSTFRWVTEYDHSVHVRPTTPYFDIDLADNVITVSLFDPTEPNDPQGCSPHYRIAIEGKGIVGAARYTLREDPRFIQGPFDIENVNEFKVLPEHYPLFIVTVDNASYSMVDYYQNKLLNTETKA